MSSENSNSEALEISLILKDLLKDNPSKLKSIINQLGGKIKSTETYYSAKAASGIKVYVDAMIKDGHDREFLFSDYPRWSHNTIRQKLESGLKYLIQNMDDKKFTYAKWREGIQVRLVKEHGIIFEHRRKKSNDCEEMEFKAYIIKNEPLIVSGEISKGDPIDEQWKDSLVEWIKNSRSGQQFERKELALVEEDKIFINQLCPEPFIVRVTSKQIRIINDESKTINPDERVIIR